MTTRTRSLCILTAAALLTSAGHADIVGFVPANYQYNPGDAGPPPVTGVDSIQLTTGRDQRRSVFFHTPQDISQFTASFTYRASDVTPCANRQGISFIVHNDSRGFTAIGGPQFSNITGPYGFGYGGIAPSAAITLELDTGPGLTYSGLLTGGVTGIGQPTTGVNAFSGHEIDVTIAYDGSAFLVTMTDAVTLASHIQSYPVGSLSAMLGSPTAFIGFGATTGGGFSSGGANQFLSDFRYTVPAPSAAWLFASVLAARRPRRPLTRPRR